MNGKAYQRILTIQDISCVGQCSMTVAMPILSACGHETCILPTALLSTHTGGFGTPAVVRFPESLTEIWHHWDRCGIVFDGILTGYLGSVQAIETAETVIDALLVPGGTVIVDPAMGDNGTLYTGFDEGYVQRIKKLCGKADVILPNLTEAALLSGNPYEETPDRGYVDRLLDDLESSSVVLTGVEFQEGQTGVMLKNGHSRQYFPHERIDGSYSGTGDIFAACFTGALMGDNSIEASIEIASEFTRRAIANTVACPAHRYGVKFETVLPELMTRLGL